MATIKFRKSVVDSWQERAALREAGKPIFAEYTGDADAEGITVNGTKIKWNDLIDALYVASECHREGTKAQSDLLQSACDYVPFIKKNIIHPSERSGLTVNL
jgi:hypothetical protein